MSEAINNTAPARPEAAAPLEKMPLEAYVPPARPSLVGLSRAELAERLGDIEVAASQRKMRVQQLWHWIYFRGAKSFDEMTSISKDTRRTGEAFYRRPAGSGRRADIQ